MTAKLLFLVRGVPGSGKSTWVKWHSSKLGCASRHFEADNYRYVDGEYVFNPEKHDEVHAKCQWDTAEAMKAGIPVIYVANTFIKKHSMLPYKLMAYLAGYEVKEHICTDEYQNIHNVSPLVVAQLRSDFEY